MSWDLMLHLDREGNEPPTCTIRNNRTHASKRPVIGVTSNTTGFAKIHLLFWCGIQSDDVRALHGYFFSCLIVRSNSASISRSKTESRVSCFKAAIALSLRKLSRLILVVTTSC